MAAVGAAPHNVDRVTFDGVLGRTPSTTPHAGHRSGGRPGVDCATGKSCAKRITRDGGSNRRGRIHDEGASHIRVLGRLSAETPE